MKRLFILMLITLLSCKNHDTKISQQKIDLPKDLPSIGKLLDSIYVEDQKYRKELNALAEKHGWESDEINKQWKKIRKVDSGNLVIIEQILSKHGWLSSKEIGEKANSTLFLVIQHSDQKTQEKYLPMMRKAVKEGLARATSLALLEDRVALGKGELQIYGSQIGTDQETGEMYVLPLKDPKNVNERRAKVGLGPIEDYISYWKLEWNVEEYLKKLPELEKELKSTHK
ncbi:DUF6624 domain-containing protein [Tenacibaculum sp. MEBiC06402]|uniref:DUF6624 domain-containing protein n=1 Tax=unclassified Tenacibaculum TaxID=2635139 RepID=UPI003B99E2C5